MKKTCRENMKSREFRKIILKKEDKFYGFDALRFHNYIYNKKKIEKIESIEKGEK